MSSFNYLNFFTKFVVSFKIDPRMKFLACVLVCTKKVIFICNGYDPYKLPVCDATKKCQIKKV